MELGLKELGLAIADMDLVICTHAHPDHIEGVQLFKDCPALFTLHGEEWQWAATIGKQMAAAYGMDMDVEWLLSGHGDIIAGAEAVRKNFDISEMIYVL